MNNALAVGIVECLAHLYDIIEALVKGKQITGRCISLETLTL